MKLIAHFAQLELGLEFAAVQEQDYDIGHKQEVHSNMVVVHNHEIVQEDGDMDGIQDKELGKEVVGCNYHIVDDLCTYSKKYTGK